MHNWLVSKDFNQASKLAAEFLAKIISECVDDRGVCHVVLPGGTSPQKCFKYLSEMELPWEKIHWYLGDERVLPEGDPDRNDKMIRKNLWSKIPDGVFHTIQTQLGIKKAVDLFTTELNNVKAIDVALLGMGEDGHTASLFPDNPALDDERDIVPVYESPKAPAERVSFSVRKLSEAGVRVVLTGGKSKADAISRVKAGEKLPINTIGNINWFIDKDADLTK